MSYARFNIDRTRVRAAGARQIESLVDEIGDGVLDAAISLVPVDTTALQGKIANHKSGKGENRINSIGVDGGTVMTGKGPKTPSEYWEFVEKGTSRSPAQPFMLPALMQFAVM